jgi:hypothetical protein
LQSRSQASIIIGCIMTSTGHDAFGLAVGSQVPHPFGADLVHQALGAEAIFVDGPSGGGAEPTT